jgi:hypothetical protein
MDVAREISRDMMPHSGGLPLGRKVDNHIS